MEVKDAIEILEEEPLNSEIILAYWNKETVEHNLDTTLTDEEWSDLCEHGNYNLDWGSVNDALGNDLEEIRHANIEESQS